MKRKVAPMIVAALVLGLGVDALTTARADNPTTTTTTTTRCANPAPSSTTTTRCR
jgi:hypothetical protein